MQVKHLTSQPQFKLLTDSQEVKEALTSLFGEKEGEELYKTYQGLFVEASDGEYKTVWAFTGIVPDLERKVVKLYPVAKPKKEEDGTDKRAKGKTA